MKHLYPAPRAAACVVTLGGLASVTPSARAASAPPSQSGCDQPAADPDPVTQADVWRQRDAQNMACATERQQDELNNPAFLRKWAVEDGESLGDLPGLALGQASEPTRPHIGIIHWMPMSKVGDPFRMPDEWEAAGRGQVQRFTFIAS